MSSGPRPLLVVVQDLLERTYRMETGLRDPASFVIGDRGLMRFYRSEEIRTVVSSRMPRGARTLVRETGEGMRASIYYPNALIRHLERFPPQYGVGDENVDEFAVLVEELDHLLLLAARSRQQREVSLLELELHANISKHLVLSRFLAGRSRRLGPRRRLWLRHRLFGGGRFREPLAEVRHRYRDAARLAVRFLDALTGIEPAERLRMLRRFHDAGAQRKIRLIESLGC